MWWNDIDPYARYQEMLAFDLEMIEGRVGDLESSGTAGSISALDARLDTLEAHNLDPRLDTLEGVSSGSRLAALEGISAGTRLTALEAVSSGSRLTALEAVSMPVVRACDCSATSVASSSLTDLAGMSFAFEANRTYVGEFELSVTQSGLLATVNLALAYSGTASSVLITDVNQGLSVGALLSNLSYSVALGATRPIRIGWRVRTTNAGTLTCQGSRTAGTCTINGGWGRMVRV